MLKRIAIDIAALLMLGGLVYQMLGTGQYLYNKLYDKVLADRQMDATVRAADGSFGGDYAGYVAFLRTAIPNDSTVLLPPGQRTYFLNDKYLMQYFLFPRDIATCQSDCADQIAEPGTYIIAQDDFPPADLVPASKELVVFNDTLGLYVPVR
jgi:hypothetical protein